MQHCWRLTKFVILRSCIRHSDVITWEEMNVVCLHSHIVASHLRIQLQDGVTTCIVKIL